MIEKPNQHFQISSLNKTTSTKQQILEGIKKASIKDLNAIVPELKTKEDKENVILSADKILNGNTPPDFRDFLTEAIILDFGRPVYLVYNSLPQLKGNDVEKFKGLIDNAISNFDLVNKIRSVGRIETRNLPGYSWVGTGWMISENLMVTNRHVAELFTEKYGSGYRFQTFFNNSVEAQVDFLAEANNENSAEFKIVDCVYISELRDTDVAVFYVQFTKPNEYAPILLSGKEPREREDIAVIGYPAFDSRVTNVAALERYYNGVFDVKRFAPGKIAALNSTGGIAAHDATTLGGNSGSVVFSLETGKAVGLHFAGKEGISNYCVTAPLLSKILKNVPSKTYGYQATPVSVIDAVAEMVGRQCKLEQYNKIDVPSLYKISGRMITYASPDSTFAVTKKFFDKAKESILIGIYDFTSDAMVACVLDAVQRGVEVSLMLDIDSKKENEVLKKLKKYGVECVPAPSCASSDVHYFSSSHEKVIVIDNKWTFIQSGNYSDNSIPANYGDGDATTGFKTGNRDMGILIESMPLAKFFTNVLRSDMKLQLSAESKETLEALLPEGEVLIEAPQRIPEPLFASEQFNFAESVEIQPVLSPDNYMSVIPYFLKSAKKSIKIEQQYIRVDQPLIKKLLDSIPTDIEVQIIVAPPIGDPTKTMHEVQTLINQYGFETRLLSKKHFVHCHNKLIIVDNEKVLISSQNWSDYAVSKNREAGVIINKSEIAEYYGKILVTTTLSDHIC